VRRRREETLDVGAGQRRADFRKFPKEKKRGEQGTWSLAVDERNWEKCGEEGGGLISGGLQRAGFTW